MKNLSIPTRVNEALPDRFQFGQGAFCHPITAEVGNVQLDAVGIHAGIHCGVNHRHCQVESLPAPLVLEWDLLDDRRRGGELGHMVIDYNGPRCDCGNYGCLETYASGPAIAAMGMKAVTQGLTTKISKLCEYDLNRITPELTDQAAQAGDGIACDIYEQAGFYLGIAASSICAAVGPQRIIIAGGVAHAGKLLLDPLERTMREHVHVMPVEQVEIVPALLGGNAGVIGAAQWLQK